MLVGGLSSVRDDYAVVGSCTRYDEHVRERLKDARLRIAEACAQPARRLTERPSRGVGFLGRRGAVVSRGAQVAFCRDDGRACAPARRS